MSYFANLILQFYISVENMPQVFQFGFDDEDVDDGSDKNVQMNTSETSPTPEETNFEEPKLLLLGEMVCYIIFLSI